MKKILSVITIAFLLGSCSVFDWAYKTANDNIVISWKDDGDVETLDSTVIIHRPTYLAIELDSTNYEKDFVKNGYEWWILKINNTLRIEVRKQDSIIYIYGKK